MYQSNESRENLLAKSRLGAIQKGRPYLGGGGGSAQSGQSKDTCVVTVTS